MVDAPLVVLYFVASREYYINTDKSKICEPFLNIFKDHRKECEYINVAGGTSLQCCETLIQNRNEQFFYLKIFFSPNIVLICFFLFYLFFFFMFSLFLFPFLRF